MFGSCKTISRKYSIFRKCYFPERKTFSCVWLSQNSFYGKLILVFGSFKRFTRKCIKSGKTLVPRSEREERRESPDQRERAQIAPLVRRSHRADERRGARSRSSIERRDQRSRSTSVLVSRRSTSALVGQSHRSSIDERRDRRAVRVRRARLSIDERRDRQ